MDIEIFHNEVAENIRIAIRVAAWNLVTVAVCYRN